MENQTVEHVDVENREVAVEEVKLRRYSKRGRNQAKYEEAKKLVAGGMYICKAEKQVGMGRNTFFEMRRRENGKPYGQKSKAGRKPAVRLLKMVDGPTVTQDFNKPLQAENQALRRLIVDMALDIQSLKDEIGRRS